MVGAIFVALSAWLMLGDDFYGHKMMPGVGWRPFAVVAALPAILAFLLTYYKIPESPRYLASKHQYVLAAAILNEHSTVQITAADLEFQEEVLHSNSSLGRGGYVPVGTDSARESIRETKSTNNVRNSTDSQLSLSAATVAFENSTIGLLFRGKLLKTSLTLLVIWFTLSFGSYGMSTWISTLFEDVGIGNPYAGAFIFALANLPGNIISLLYIEKYGRRWLLSMGMCLAAASALGFAFDTKLPTVVVLCASLFNAFSVIGWNSLDCLSGMHTL